MERVNIYFDEYGVMYVRAPYNRDFLDYLSLNGIPRAWDTEKKVWRFPGKYAPDVMKLLEDAYD